MISGNALVYGDTAATRAYRPEIVHSCKACLKAFTTAGNLARHMESSRVCRAWVASRVAPRRPETHVPEDATNAVQVVLTGSMLYDALAVTGKNCKSCGKEFATPGSLTRHYRTSLACDRTRARDLLDTLKESFADFGRGQHCELLQDTGFPEAGDVVARPEDVVQVIAGPALIELPKAINVREL